MYKPTIKLRIKAYVLRFCLFIAYWIVTLEKIAVYRNSRSRY